MRKTLTVPMTIVAVLVVGLFIYFKYDPNRVYLDDVNPGATTTPEVNLWPVYENTKFKYQFRRPPSAVVQKIAEMERGTENESENITVAVPGIATLAQVMTWVPSKNVPTEPAGIERNRLASLDLDSFAKEIHQLQVDNENPYITKNVGTLEEITFNGKKAYRFTLTGGFDSGSGGYSIPVGQIHAYILAEHNGNNFTISYPLNNETTGRLIGTFEFVE